MAGVERDPELLLLDVYALVYRAYFALPPLTTSHGKPSSAIYGFERMLNRMLATEKPTHVAACFDAGIPAERFEAVPQYKAHRPEMPSDLAPQFDGVREALAAYGIRIIEVEGEEADDCIATLATRASADGIDTAIVSGDLDLLQLVDDRIKVVVTRRGITDMQRYDAQAVRGRFGLDPGQLPDYRGLKGDPSDNLPGVPGIGEKTAAKLIAQYGTLDALLAHAGDVTPKRISALLVQYADQARRCRDVSVAKRALPIDIAWDNLRYESPPREQLAKFYAAFDFRTLFARTPINRDAVEAELAASVAPAPPVVAEPIAVRYRALEDATAAAHAVRALAANAAVAIALVPGHSHGEASALAFCATPGDAFVVPSRLIADASVASEVDSVLGGATPRKNVHDAKALYAWASASGRYVNGIAFDTMLAAGLLDPTLGEPTLAEAARFAGATITVAESAPASAAIELFAAPAAVDPDLASAADAISRAAPALERMLEDAGGSALLRDVELPLSRVLADVERRGGFRLDLAELDRIRAELDGMIAAASAEIYALAGEEFNLNSPKAVGAILFEKMALPGGTKKKTGFATGIEVLAPLAAEHPIAAKILDYREVAKLKSTYVDALPALVDPKTGWLRTTLHQLGAATGRLSSTNPNLQNIPVRTAAGRAIRRAFVPSEGNALLAADYSQIELRLFAHLSQDPHLMEAFATGQDVHAFTARAIFGVPADQPLDPELRHRAKAINFGVLYGMGSFGLAQSAGITRAEAREFIAQYFKRFDRVRGYIDDGLARARSNGFVITMLGRRRYLPDLRASNHALRAAAERMAINAPLQGSAADLIKLAMVRVAAALDDAQLQAHMLLQVHDELIFEAPPTELAPLRDIVRTAMEHAMHLSVPIAVDFKSGPTWADIE